MGGVDLSYLIQFQIVCLIQQVSQHKPHACFHISKLEAEFPNNDYGRLPNQYYYLTNHQICQS